MAIPDLNLIKQVKQAVARRRLPRLGDPELIEIDLIAVKGKTQAGRVYTLPPEEIEEAQFIDRHSALLRAYRRQDWAAALRLLDDGLLTAARHLAPVDDLYRRRIAQFQIKAPPQNWDGVFTAEESDARL